MTDDDLIFAIVSELSGAGWNVTAELISRRTKLDRRQVTRALTSLHRRGMIVPRRWGAPPGTFIPTPRSDDAQGIPSEGM